VQRVPSLQRTAFEICADVIAGPPPTATDIPDRDTLITTRWLHRELDEVIPPLPVHIVATYYGPLARRAWRCGRMSLAGVGRPGGIGVVPADWSGHWDTASESTLS
jgi:AraC family transcriptional regulator